MGRSCPKCGAALPDNANNCPMCGVTVVPVGGGAAAIPVVQATGALADNLAAALCYVPFFLGIIACIVLLIIEPYRRSKYVRFHAFQSLLTHAVFLALSLALGILGGMLTSLLPIFAFVEALVALACLLLLLLLMYKAYQNTMIEVPFLGPLAARQAGV